MDDPDKQWIKYKIAVLQNQKNLVELAIHQATGADGVFFCGFWVITFILLGCIACIAIVKRLGLY